MATDLASPRPVELRITSVSDNVLELADGGWQVEQSNQGHRLQLHLYSADGSIVAFTDHNAQVTQTIRDEDGAIVFSADSTSVYDVVMFLEDGNWRVRHWLRTDSAGG